MRNVLTQKEAATKSLKKVQHKGIEYLLSCELTFLFFFNNEIESISRYTK